MPQYGPLVVDVAAVTATQRPVHLDVELLESGTLDLLVQFVSAGAFMPITTGVPRFEIMTEQCILLEQYAFVLGATEWVGENLAYGRMGWHITGARPQLQALAVGKPHRLRWRLAGALVGGRDVSLVEGYLLYTRAEPGTVPPPGQDLSPDLVRRAVTVQVFGAGGGAPPLGDAAVFSMPFTGDIVEYYVNAIAAGSATFDVYRRPAHVAGSPVEADTICFSNKPALTSDVYKRGTDLDLWSTRLNVGDKIRVVLLSESGTQGVSLTLVVDPA